MTKISFRIPDDLAAQIRALAGDLGATESEAFRLLLQRGLAASTADRLTQDVQQVHALLRALSSEVALISTLAEEHAVRSIPREQRDEYRAGIRRRKEVAEGEIHSLATRHLDALEG